MTIPWFLERALKPEVRRIAGAVSPINHYNAYEKYVLITSLLNFIKDKSFDFIKEKFLFDLVKT